MGKGTFAIVILIVLAVLIGGVLYFKSVDNFNSMTNDDTVTNDTNSDEEATQVVDSQMISDITTNKGTLSGELLSVIKDNSTAIAYLLRQEDRLDHLVNAFLPELTGNEFYEGWLVKEQPSLVFFSTGKMIKLSEGQYQLTFSSANSYEGFNNAIITKETVDDRTPEEHILEGVVK